MNWTLVGGILVAIGAAFFVCCVWATIELEITKYREGKKWREWAEREKRRKV